MSDQEAQRMVALLARVITDRGAVVSWYVNDIGQPVVQVDWSTGPIYLVSVRQCMRYVEHYRQAKR